MDHVATHEADAWPAKADDEQRAADAAARACLRGRRVAPCGWPPGSATSIVGALAGPCRCGASPRVDGGVPIDRAVGDAAPSPGWSVLVASCVSHVTCRLFAAEPDRRRRSARRCTTVQMTRPSVTGPIRPRPAPPGLGSSSHARDVGDDRPLLLRGQRAVVEHRHRLRAGEHRLVDVLRRWTSFSGGAYLPLGQGAARRRRSCGTGRSWCGTARRPRRCRRRWRRPPRRSGSAGPGAERGDVGGDLPRSASSLNMAPCLRGACAPGAGQRHPAGADLEVDGGGADADQASGPSAGALAVEAVAGWSSW